MEIIAASAAYWMVGDQQERIVWIKMAARTLVLILSPSLQPPLPKMTVGKREDTNPENRKKGRGVLVDERVQQTSLRLKGDGGVKSTYLAE